MPSEHSQDPAEGAISPQVEGGETGTGEGSAWSIGARGVASGGLLMPCGGVVGGTRKAGEATGEGEGIVATIGAGMTRGAGAG